MSIDENKLIPDMVAQSKILLKKYKIDIEKDEYFIFQPMANGQGITMQTENKEKRKVNIFVYDSFVLIKDAIEYPNNKDDLSIDIIKNKVQEILQSKIVPELEKLDINLDTDEYQVVMPINELNVAFLNSEEDVDGHTKTTISVLNNFIILDELDDTLAIFE